MTDPSGYEPTAPVPGPLRASSPPDGELEALMAQYRAQAQNAGAPAFSPAVPLVFPPPGADQVVAPPVPAAQAAHLAETPSGFQLPDAYPNAHAVVEPVIEAAAEPEPAGFVVPPAQPVVPPAFVVDDDADFSDNLPTRTIDEATTPEWSGPEQVARVDPQAVYEMGDRPSPWAAYEDVETHSDIEPPLAPPEPVIAPLDVTTLPPSFASIITGVPDASPAVTAAPIAEAAPIAPELMAAPAPAFVAEASPEQIAAPAQHEVAITPAPSIAVEPAPHPGVIVPEVQQPVIVAADVAPTIEPVYIAEQPAVVAEPPAPVFDVPFVAETPAPAAPAAPPVLPAPAAEPAPVLAPVPTPAPASAFDAASFFDEDAELPPLQPVPEYTIPGPVTQEPVYQPAPAAPYNAPAYTTPVAPPAPAAAPVQQPTAQSPLAGAGGNRPAREWLDSALRDLTAIGASDVHLSRSGATGNLRVEARRDGVLEHVRTWHDAEGEAILNLLKTHASISTGSNRVPDDGRYELPIDGYPYRIRAVSLPLFDGGEKLVLRLPQTGDLRQLHQLGFWTPNLERTLGLARLPGGMTLIAGPMGEGKTTTAHAFLAEVGRGDTAITTVEDPVERVLSGVAQIEVNEEIGSGFGDVMRYLVRADFDTLFIGEIRDQATAAAAVRMAKAGRRVISTIHATDNVTALLRLIELSSDTPLSVLDAVRGVISQRLVRRVGNGADGYLGRAPIHEVLTVNEELVEELITGKSIGAIRAAAAKTSSTFRQNIDHLIAEGVTDTKEAERVLGHA